MDVVALRNHVCDQVAMRLGDYGHWWGYNTRRKNLLFAANVGCGLGATISGLYGCAKLAGIFGAFLTAILAFQKHFPLEEEAAWYGVAISRCKIMLAKAKSPTATSESLAAVESDLIALIAEEAQKTKSLQRQQKEPTDHLPPSIRQH